MKNNRSLCLLLALLALAAPVMVACAEKKDDPNTTVCRSTTATETVPEEELDSLEARKKVSDNIEVDSDWAGRSYVIATEDDKKDDTIMEESSAEVLEDAIFLRNEKIQERFGITIEAFTRSTYDELTSAIRQSVTASDDAYQLISYHVVSAGGLATGNYLYNWYDIPNIDFSRPWWSESNEKDLTTDGVCKLAIGDFALSAFKQTYCMYFNKEKAASYNIDNLYEVVNNGAWTKDYMASLTKDVWEDLDGDGKEDKDDFYGYVMTNGSAVNTFLWAFDNPIFQKDSDGMLEYVYKTEKVGEIVKWLDEYLFKTKGSYSTRSSNNDSFSEEMYRKDQAIFTTGTFNTAIKWRDVEVDFGIIPYPKWDENQDYYYTMADGNHAAMGVPYSAMNLDFIGAVTEVLCAETWKTVQPTYYDVALKVKGARDEESIAILDMIFEHRVFDFGYVFDNWKGVSFFLQWMLADGNTNFESYYKSREKTVTKYYSKVIESFEKYGE